MTNDPQGMLQVVRSSPDLWAKGAAIAWHLPTWTVPQPTAVIVAGMGGSGIAGDVATLMAGMQGTAPVIVVKGYDLPAWAGPRTPLVAVSHSGNTEETLAAVADGIDRGCPLAAVTSGGRLAEVVEKAGGPVIEIPGEHQPRASFPLLVPPTLALLEAAGVLDGGRATVDVADDLGPRMAALEDRARRDAEQLADRIPVFVGGRGVPSLVAARGKCQVNENAERPAFCNELPEGNHNEIVGWGGKPKAPFTLAPIREDGGHELSRIGARFEITAELLAHVTHNLPDMCLPSAQPMARLAAGVAWVDLLSVHLALLDGVDPTPVARIQELKRRMETR